MRLEAYGFDERNYEKYDERLPKILHRTCNNGLNHANGHKKILPPYMSQNSPFFFLFHPVSYLFNLFYALICCFFAQETFSFRSDACPCNYKKPCHRSSGSSGNSLHASGLSARSHVPEQIILMWLSNLSHGERSILT